MKKLNQFITEYIIKKKLDHPINSEIDSTNIVNTICEIFNIQDENIIDEISSFISKNKFNDAEYFMTRLETAIYKKHISKTNETINNINNGLHNMPKDVFITELKLPAGKDINDLTKEEFDYLLKIS